MVDISVVIPCLIDNKQQADVLLSALDSILHQTIAPSRYEIILADDGSSINLRAELSGILNSTPNLKLLRQENKGPAAARNRATELACGEIILYLGADIIVEPNLLQAHLDVHGKEKDIYVINPMRAHEAIIFGTGYFQTRLDEFVEGHKYFMPNGDAFCTNCVSIKKHLIENVKFDENFRYPAYEDIDLGHRLHLNGVGFMVTKQTSALHNHPHSIATYRRRSRNFGEALIYLKHKNPQIQVNIKCAPGSLISRAKKLFFALLVPVLTLISALPFRRVKIWCVEIMCRYDFLNGAHKSQCIRNKPAFIQKAFNFLAFLTRLRALRTVIFFVTNRCNARCTTCFYWKELNRPITELSLDQIRAIAKSIDNLETLQISGGEPFLRDDLDRICEIFIKRAKVKNIHIPTNGLLTEKIYTQAKKIAGIDREVKIFLCLAMDGLDKQHDRIRGVPGNFEALLKTVDMLKQLEEKFRNFSFAIVTTVCAQNYAEYENIHAFVTRDLGVTHMTDIVRMNTARQKEIEAIPADFLNRIMVPQAPEKKGGGNFENRLRSYIQYEQKLISARFWLSAREGKNLGLPCPAGKNTAVIGPDGTVALCEGRRDAIGNLKDYDYNLHKLLNSPAARNMHERIKSEKCACDNSLFLYMKLSYYRRFILIPVIKGLIKAIRPGV